MTEMSILLLMTKKIYPPPLAPRGDASSIKFSALTRRRVL